MAGPGTTNTSMASISMAGDESRLNHLMASGSSDGGVVVDLIK